MAGARTLAVDHGLARLGCAVSDPSGTIVRPLEVIEPPEAGGVARLARELEADRIVVGLPLDLGGAEGGQAALVREFCAELERLVRIPVETWDERLTTTMAAASRRTGAAAPEDSLAAAHLLESYLAVTASGPGEGNR